MPVIIENYNKFMGGVDKSDQYLQYHSSFRRTIRYWKTLFYHMLDVAVVNSMVIYNWGSMELGGKPLSENQFRDTLILQMIGKYRAPHPQSIPGQLPPILILSPHLCRIHHGSIIEHNENAVDIVPTKDTSTSQTGDAQIVHLFHHCAKLCHEIVTQYGIVHPLTLKDLPGFPR